MMSKRLFELALIGLEAERSRIDHEINDLKAQLSGTPQAQKREQKEKVSSSARPAAKSKGRGNRSKTTAETRKRLSEAAKRRWVQSKRLGKKTL